MRDDAEFPAPISREIWDLKYRLKGSDGSAIDSSLDDTFWRVARAAASAEKGGKKVREQWAKRFHDAIADLGFLPAGRILAGAGTGRSVTLFNCFVLGKIEDDLSAIFEGVKDAALTMQQGGGIGHDFSTLRPKGASVASIGADASGPVSFMEVWDAMCRTIMSAGSRRGAMMATLRCDHPDIEAFIEAKSEPGRLRNFNLSVLVTDDFLAAVRADKPWELKFGGKVYRTLPARALWERIMRATYDFAEPGVVFIDRVNARNNLNYCEEIHATNPCGEQPLPPYGACLLGSINLARLIDHPFTSGATLDRAKLEERVKVAVRFLDNIIDVSNYPLEAQRKEAMSKRRIGLGVTGLADALIFAGVRYGTPEAAKLAGGWMAIIQNAAYAASAELAAEKGAFPLYDAKRFLAAPTLPRSMRRCARRYAPTAYATAASPRSRRPEPFRCSPATCRAASSQCSTIATPAGYWRGTERRTSRRWRTTRTPSSVGSSALPPRYPIRSCAPATSLRPSTSPCRRPCSRGSTAPSPRPSTVPRTLPSRRSRTSTSRRMRSGSRVAPPTGPTQSPERYWLQGRSPSPARQPRQRLPSRPLSKLCRHRNGRGSSTWRRRSSARACSRATPTSSNGRAATTPST